MKINEIALFPENSEHQVNVWFYIDPVTGAQITGMITGAVLLLLVIYKRLL